MTDDEIKRVKSQLWDWGDAIDRCRRKQEDIKRLEDMIESMRSVGSIGLTGMPKGTNTPDTTQKAALKIVDTYETTIRKLTNDIELIMTQKRKVDNAIAQLSGEQRKIIEYVYAKGYGWEHIPLKMNYSRRQCFRIRDEALEFLALNGTKFGL